MIFNLMQQGILILVPIWKYFKNMHLRRNMFYLVLIKHKLQMSICYVLLAIFSWISQGSNPSWKIKNPFKSYSKYSDSKAEINKS